MRMARFRRDIWVVAAGYDPGTGRCAPTSTLACGTGAEIAELRAAAANRTYTPAIATEIDQLFSKFIASTPQATVDDLDGVLGKLADGGLVLGLATMDSEAGAHAALAELGITARFSFVAGYDSGHGHKPGPGMLQAFCRQCRLEPRQVIMVGDTTHDIGMGISAGAGMTVAVLSGASGAEAFAGQADVVLNDVSELPEMLLG